MAVVKANFDDGGVSSGLRKLKLYGDSPIPNPRKDLLSSPPIPNPRKDTLSPPPIPNPNPNPRRPNVIFEADCPPELLLTEADDVEWLNGIAQYIIENQGKVSPVRKDPAYEDDFIAEGADPDDWKDLPLHVVKCPDPLECEICGRAHYESCCPYLMSFPPDGELRNTNTYKIVCACTEEVLDGRTPCSTQDTHPRANRWVMPRFYPRFSISSPICQ